jgi:sugar lactone lactonase YvrE
MKRLACTIVLWGFAMLNISEHASAQRSAPLISIAQEHHAIWNGVTVSRQGRIFVNYPAMSPRPILAVGEVQADGSVRPYPGGEWNQWTPGRQVEHAFVGTNAVRIGPDGDLWVVDTGSPSFGAETLPNAPKIVRIDLTQNVVRRIYRLGAEIAQPKSYVDDIRFHGHLAYLTDAGVPGIIVLDLDTGHARRVLDHDKSTTGTHPIVVDGETLRGADGQPVILHADQMEVSPDGKWFYFQPLSGPMHRIETRLLDDPSIPGDALSRSVEFWYATGSLGGTTIDNDGNLYLEDLGNDSIVKLTPDRKATILYQDHRLHWVDAPWIHDGWLYLPQAQIDRAAQFHGGKSRIEWPLHLYKLPLDVPAK